MTIFFRYTLFFITKDVHMRGGKSVCIDWWWLFSHNILWYLLANNILNLISRKNVYSFFQKKLFLVLCVIVISSPDDDGKEEKKDNCSWLRQPISLTAKENLNTDLYASWTIPNNFHYLIWKHRCVFMYILCCIAIYTKVINIKWIH